MLMKKFTYLFAALSMMAVSANAQDEPTVDEQNLVNAATYTNPEFGGEVIALENGSFEVRPEDGDGTTNFGGWEVVNTSNVNWATRAHKSMYSKINGSYYVRLMNASLEPGTLLKQSFAGKGPGTYVLSAITQFTRNSNRGFSYQDEAGTWHGGWNEANWAALYIMDNEDFDGGLVASPGYKKIFGQFNEDNTTGELPFIRQFVAYRAEYGEAMQIGFGLTEECAAIGKAQIQCDAFKVEYVPGKTVEEVNAMIENITTGIEAIKTVNEKAVDANAPIYNLAGQRVTKDAKGILIQNGKKFVVK